MGVMREVDDCFVVRDSLRCTSLISIRIHVRSSACSRRPARASVRKLGAGIRHVEQVFTYMLCFNSQTIAGIRHAEQVWTYMWPASGLLVFQLGSSRPESGTSSNHRSQFILN